MSVGQKSSLWYASVLGISGYALRGEIGIRYTSDVTVSR